MLISEAFILLSCFLVTVRNSSSEGNPVTAISSKKFNLVSQRSCFLKNRKNYSTHFLETTKLYAYIMVYMVALITPQMVKWLTRPKF